MFPQPCFSNSLLRFGALFGAVLSSKDISHDLRRGANFAKWRSKDCVAISKQPEVQAHMKQAAALAISFDPVDYDLRDIVLAE